VWDAVICVGEVRFSVVCCHKVTRRLEVPCGPCTRVYPKVSGLTTCGARPVNGTALCH
jgi:hypothetical protein